MTNKFTQHSAYYESGVHATLELKQTTNCILNIKTTVHFLGVIIKNLVRSFLHLFLTIVTSHKPHLTQYKPETRQ